MPKTKEKLPLEYAHATPYGIHDGNIDRPTAEQWLISRLDRNKGKRCVYNEEIQRWTIEGRYVFATTGELIDLQNLGD